MLKWTKPPAVRIEDTRAYVRADFELNGIQHTRKSVTLTGSDLQQVMAGADTAARHRIAVEIATRRWRTKLGGAAEQQAAPTDPPAALERKSRARKEPDRLQNEQEPIKKYKSQEATGSRHEAKAAKGKQRAGKNTFRSEGSAVGAWQKLGSFALHVLCDWVLNAVN